MIINNLEKIIDKEIFTLFDYLETKNSYQQGWLWKSHFINDFINKTVDIFMSQKKRANYKFVLKLQHKRIIITPGNSFKYSDQTKIEFLLTNDILLPL